jgi:hypothetical protein
MQLHLWVAFLLKSASQQWQLKGMFASLRGAMTRSMCQGHRSHSLVSTQRQWSGHTRVEVSQLCRLHKHQCPTQILMQPDVVHQTLVGFRSPQQTMPGYPGTHKVQLIKT